MTVKRSMVPLGFGSFVRADRVVALLPIEKSERSGGRRTYVHVEGVPGPIVASRSEGAILDDIHSALEEQRTQDESERSRPIPDDGLRRLFARQRRPERR